jgi:magnesium-transporting ATPase (P-type)
MVFALFLFWYPSLRVRFFYNKVKDIHSAPSHVVVEGTHDHVEILRLRPSVLGSSSKVKLTSFTYRFIKFEFDFDSCAFLPVVFNATMSQKNLLSLYSSGIEKATHKDLLERYGACQLVVPRKSFWRLVIDEILNFFILFQVFAVSLWITQGYTNYSYCIIAISVASIIENLYEIISNTNSIQRMAHYECPVEVLRRDKGQSQTSAFEPISSTQLVPGDVVKVPENTQMPCDLVLLSGSAIVNEAMLTGESVPVIKTAISPIDQVYDP